ncbi:hypothetical protein Calla_0299 [Caldicellulosiruptor acetigenus 6A]|uniref:Uncharacterized protein n=1 Tax=Caldicellulosiruptor acetigenus 6A TaxID=632516 RepID=G2PX15_9FIRM|nr:hypothetical protein Calla_0299 [Caldicellulosiruptor acetigenus 6A]
MVTRKREKSKEKREISRQKRTVSRLGGYMQIKKVYFVCKILRGKRGKKSVKSATPRLWWLYKQGGKSREKGGKSPQSETNQRFKGDNLFYRIFSQKF